MKEIKMDLARALVWGAQMAMKAKHGFGDDKKEANGAALYLELQRLKAMVEICNNDGGCRAYSTKTPSSFVEFLSLPEKEKIRLVLRKAALPVKKEPFYCCKDQDNPCHPIGSYCSSKRPKP